MVEDSHAGPENIDKRFQRDSVGKRKANRPTKVQIKAFKHNMKRAPKNAPPTPPGSGQAPASPGSPVADIDTVCTLYNFAASIKLPHLVSEMNREAMCSAGSQTMQQMRPLPAHRLCFDNAANAFAACTFASTYAVRLSNAAHAFMICTLSALTAHGCTTQAVLSSLAEWRFAGTPSQWTTTTTAPLRASV